MGGTLHPKGRFSSDGPDRRAIAGARPELQYHDGDDHGEHPIAEAFQAGRTSGAEQVSPAPQRATHAEARGTVTARTPS